jgi:hypothetical protein
MDKGDVLAAMLGVQSAKVVLKLGLNNSHSASGSGELQKEVFSN